MKSTMAVNCILASGHGHLRGVSEWQEGLLRLQTAKLYRIGTQNRVVPSRHVSHNSFYAGTQLYVSLSHCAVRQEFFSLFSSEISFQFGKLLGGEIQQLSAATSILRAALRDAKIGMTRTAAAQLEEDEWRLWSAQCLMAEEVGLKPCSVFKYNNIKTDCWIKQ